MVTTAGAIRRTSLFAPAVVTILFVPGHLPAQDSPSGEFVIEDNSSLIEEAYNQEPGVVQHISNFVHVSPLSERSGRSPGRRTRSVSPSCSTRGATAAWTASVTP